MVNASKEELTVSFYRVLKLVLGSRGADSAVPASRFQKGKTLTTRVDD